MQALGEPEGKGQCLQSARQRDTQFGSKIGLESKCHWLQHAGQRDNAAARARTRSSKICSQGQCLQDARQRDTMQGLVEPEVKSQ